MSDVLLTGGAGFIGANLARMLLRRGYSVIVLDDLSVGDLSYLRGLNLRVIEGDIRNRELLLELMAETPRVVHLAAQSGVPTSLADPYRDCELNVLGTLNVLEALRNSGGTVGDKKLILASSNAPLGRQAPPTTEDKAPLPISPYGASKLAAEAYCLAYHGSWGLPTIALRFGNVYGPYSAHKNSVVARFLRDVHDSGTITIEGDGTQTRDFIFVEDLCSAVVSALETAIAGEVIQIATGVETSISQVADAIRHASGCSFDTTMAPARQGDMRRSFADIGKALSTLGWEPRVNLEEGIHRTEEWFTEWRSITQE